MKLNWKPTRLSLAIAAGLAVSAISAHAQNVIVTATISDVAAGGGVFDYTFTLHNTGTEAVKSLWVGWIPGVFDVASPTSVANNLGWSSAVDGNSIQYGGGTALASGSSGIFTFDSTSTPAQFTSGAAGDSTAYGINAAHGQLSFTLSPPDTETFNPTVAVVPEPSVLSLIGLGALGLKTTLRRKLRSL
jgi:hypothetical protein